MDLAFARQEHQHIAGPFVAQFIDGGAQRLHLIALVVVSQRPIANLDRVGASLDGDDRGVVEVLAEPLRVDGRRGDDQLQVRSSRQQLADVAEQEVDVQAALVGLVDDQGVVAAQHAIALDLGQQDAVGHHLDPGLLTDAIGEPHGVADRGTQLAVHLLGYAIGDRARRDAPRLGVADHPVDSPAGTQAELRQLGALARSGLAGDDHHLMRGDGGDQLIGAFQNRQFHRCQSARPCCGSSSRLSEPRPTTAMAPSAERCLAPDGTAGRRRRASPPPVTVSCLTFDVDVGGRRGGSFASWIAPPVVV